MQKLNYDFLITLVFHGNIWIRGDVQPSHLFVAQVDVLLLVGRDRVAGLGQPRLDLDVVGLGVAGVVAVVIAVLVAVIIIIIIVISSAKPGNRVVSNRRDVTLLLTPESSRISNGWKNIRRIDFTIFLHLFSYFLHIKAKRPSKRQPSSIWMNLGLGGPSPDLFFISAIIGNSLASVALSIMFIMSFRVSSSKKELG